MNKPLRTIFTFALAFTAAGVLAASTNAKPTSSTFPVRSNQFPKSTPAMSSPTMIQVISKILIILRRSGTWIANITKGTIDPTQDNAGDTFATTDATTTTANSFKTQWFLPDGFQRDRLPTR